MLILTRRSGETLMIGDQVTVTVLGVRVTKCVLVSMLLSMWQCIVKRSIIVFSVVTSLRVLLERGEIAALPYN